MKPISIYDIDWSKTRAVILDLDGTIYNKKRLALHLIFSELLTLPFLVRERSVYKQFKGRYFGSADSFYDAFFKKMARGGKIFSARTARNWYFNDYMPLMKEAICFFYKPENWALNLIKYCKENHIPICVVSDYCFVEEKLRSLRIDPSQFDFVVCTPDLGGLKPAKPIMEKIVARLGVPAENCLVIGDRADTDGAMAQSVGAMFLKC